MVFEGELAVKLYTKDGEVVISADRNASPVTVGRVHSPRYTNN